MQSVPTTLAVGDQRPDADRLTDRELFAARPWRAPDRTQVIFAVIERSAPGEPGWFVAVATLHGAVVFRRRLPEPRSPAAFTEDELQAIYLEGMSAAA